jgi:hypothetical protein
VYGYDRAGQVIDGEAGIVREIFERTAAGDPVRVITNELNARGIPSPGARWNRTERRHDGRCLISALNAMLQNERYIGRVIWNRSIWVKDPDTGKPVRRERPESEWTITECPALVGGDTWQKVQRRMEERATGERRGHGVRRCLLSGLLIYEHCGGRFVAAGKDGSHYICSTHTQGGDAACPVGRCISRQIAESIVLEPVQRELLGPKAVERACELIRGWVRTESAQITESANPELEAIATEIADLEALIQARPARAGTLRQVVEGLRAREANLKRGARRQAQATLAGQVPAEEAYRAAVAEMAATLESSNVEGARVALRSLIGTISVFEDAGKLYGRLGVDPMPLYRRNPAVLGGMVAGA